LAKDRPGQPACLICIIKRRFSQCKFGSSTFRDCACGWQPSGALHTTTETKS